MYKMFVSTSTVRCNPIRIGHIFPHKLRAETICFTYVFYMSQTCIFCHVFSNSSKQRFFYVKSGFHMIASIATISL